jgi:hypothetical protein
MSGMVHFNGTTERPTSQALGSLSIVLTPADVRPGVQPARGRTESTGTFATSGVPPGKYLVSVQGGFPNWTFQSAMVNGRDASIYPVDVESNDLGGVMINFTDRPSDISGQVSADRLAGSAERAGVSRRSNVMDGTRRRISASIPLRRAQTRTASTAYPNVPCRRVSGGRCAGQADRGLAAPEVPRIADAIGHAVPRAGWRQSGAEPEGGTMSSTRTMNAAVCAGVSVILLSAAVLAQVRDTRPPTPPPPPQQQARDVAAPAAGKAALSGTVVTDEQTPQPIKRAQITVSNTDLTVTRTTFTNDSGRFTITGLPAGRYTLAASKAPYLRTNYGAKRYDRPGTPITLKEAEQMPNLTLRMTRGAVAERNHHGRERSARVGGLGARAAIARAERRADVCQRRVVGVHH